MEETAVVMADRNGVIVFWNARAESVFGYPAAEAVGRTLDLIIPAEHRPDHWKGFRRAMNAGATPVEGQVTPFPACMATGAVTETPGRLTLLRDPSGRAVAAMVAFGPAPAA